MQDSQKQVHLKKYIKPLLLLTGLDIGMAHQHSHVISKGQILWQLTPRDESPRMRHVIRPTFEHAKIFSGGVVPQLACQL